MKNTMLFLSLLFPSIFFSQEPSKELVNALRTDDVMLFIEAVGSENLDQCYTVNGSTYSLLALSIKTGAINCLKSLVEKEVDIEKACESKTPLFYAVKYGKLEMLKILVEKGADHKITNRGRTAKDYAKKYKRTKVLEYLTSLE